jgi:predicted nucleotidyltransferase
MRPTYTVEAILGSRSRIAVLRVLLGVMVPLNASQIAARTGLTRPAVATALDDLAAAGIVQSTSVGRANVHMLVRENDYVQRIIEPAFSGEASVPDDLIDYLRTKFESLAKSVVLFGSYARGDQDASSDVDVVLVAADGDAKTRLEGEVYDLTSDFHLRFGAHLSPLIYDLEGAIGLERRAPDLIASLRADGLTAHGLSPWEWGRNA